MKTIEELMKPDPIKRDQQINEAAITVNGSRFTKSLEFIRGAKWADQHPLDATASRRFLANDLEKAK